jgi:hypothetical protein
LGNVDINMAEAIGFIIGEYTIPADLPIIYINDSNKARSLQKRMKNVGDFTHRKMVRQIKQGIDYSITYHLEHLTEKWLHEEQLSANNIRRYKRGEAMCNKWASSRSDDNQDSITLHSETDDTETIEDEYLTESSSMSVVTDNCENIQAAGKNRYRFDSSMIDLLGRIIIVKVYSHQLNEDFTTTYSYLLEINCGECSNTG